MEKRENRFFIVDEETAKAAFAETCLSYDFERWRNIFFYATVFALYCPDQINGYRTSFFLYEKSLSPHSLISHRVDNCKKLADLVITF